MCVPVTLKHKDVYIINGTVQWFQAILRNRGAVLHLFMTLSGTGETTPRVSVQTYMHQLQDLLFLLIHYLTLNTWFHCARFSPSGMTGLPDSAVCDMQLVTAFRCLCFGPLDQSVQVTSMWGNATITGCFHRGSNPNFLCPVPLSSRWYLESLHTLSPISEVSATLPLKQFWLWFDW